MRNDIKRFFVAVLAACGLAVSAANVAAVPLTLIPESGDARCAIVVDPAVMASGSSTTGLVNPALEAEKQRIRLRGETKICPVCNAEVDGDACFCNHCGAQL